MPGPAPAMRLPTHFDPKVNPNGTRYMPTALTRAQLNDWVGAQQTPQHQAAAAILFQGRNPLDFRFFPNGNLDPLMVAATVRAFKGCDMPDMDTRLGNLAVALANFHTQVTK